MAGEKRKLITINNVNGGIGSDKYLTLPNGVYDAEGVNLGLGKRTTLSTNSTKNVTTIPNSSVVTTLGSTYWAGDNGYIYDSTGATVYKYQSGALADYGITNFIDQTISGTSYTLFFGRSKVMRYSAESSVSLSWGTTGGAWTQAGTVWTHNTGNTTVLTATGTVTTSSYYRVKIVVQSMSAGTITVALGGATGQVISANGTYYLFFLATSTANMTITPTSTFNGAIETFSTTLGQQNVVESYKTLPKSSYTAPMIAENGNIYFGNANVMAGIDSVGTVNTYFTLPANEQINGLTKVGDQYVLWVDDGQGGKQYFWDGLTNAPVRVVYWYNERIMNVTNQGAYHIVTTGNDFSIKKIWRSDGYNKVMLYKIPSASFSTTSNKLLPTIPLRYGGRSTMAYCNAIESLGDLVFLPAYGGVLSLGKKTAGFPDAMCLEWKIATTEIYAMYAYNDNLYISYDDGGTCKVTQIKLESYENILDSTTLYQYGALGHITYNPFVFNVAQNKSGVNLKLGYKLQTSTFISLYYAKDRDQSYYTFVVNTTTNPITVMPTVGAVYRTGTNARFTVTKVTTQSGYTFIECLETVKEFTPRVTSTFTKVSGTGDATIAYIKFHNFKHLSIISDTAVRKYRKDFRENFTEVQFRVELISENGIYTSEINDFSLVYDEEQND